MQILPWQGSPTPEPLSLTSSIWGFLFFPLLFFSFLFLEMSKEVQVFRDILTVVKWKCEILGHLI